MPGHSDLENVDAWDEAQYCESGHLINPRLREQPWLSEKHCSRCGRPTLSACRQCANPIRGASRLSGHRNLLLGHAAPAFCNGCGEPYPWTSERLAAARAIVQEAEGLDSESKRVFGENVQDLVSDQPRTKLAAERIRKVLAKLAGPAAATVRGILIEVVSETAKKIIVG